MKLTKDQQHDLLMVNKKAVVCAVGGIEINTLTDLQTELIIDNNLLPKGMTLDQADVVRYVKKGVDMILESEDQEITLDWLKNLNYTIFKSDRRIPVGGRIRSGSVYITNTTYKPPVVTEKLASKMIKYLEYIEDPKLRAAEALIVFSKTQLFEDCNKRTSLLLANKILFDAREGILVIASDQREEYLTKLKAFYEDEASKEEFKEWIVENCIYSDFSRDPNSRKLGPEDRER